MRSTHYLLIIAIALFISCATVPPEELVVKIEKGSGIKELTRITNEEQPQFYPAPSPDGKNLLVTVRDLRKHGREQWSIASIKIGSAGRQLVTQSYSLMPSWLPDGSGFVYTYIRPQKSRLVRSARGSAIAYIGAAPLGDADSAPDVSPDGEKIALHTLIGNDWMVATVGLDGSLFTVLCPGRNPKWSPSGRKILFQREVSGYFHIFTIDIENGQITQLTDGEHYDIMPCWSPDGKYIAFVSNREDDRFHLYLMNNNGDGIIKLTVGKTDEFFPAWSSDGYLYFCSNVGKGMAKFTSKGWVESWNYSNIWRLRPPKIN